jgi:hypothetical protein
MNRSIGLVLGCAMALSLLVGPVHAQVTAGEREALIRLYEATAGDRWKRRTSWRAAVGTECQWYGIVCSHGDGEVRHVTQLLLNNNGLTGSLPAELNELEHLTTLLLSDNALEGTLPEDLWNLEQLRYLTLADNNLSGDIPGALLDHRMEGLNLSGNRFSGFGIPDTTPQWPAEPRTLMLADNLFQELPPAVWRQHGRIQSLDLSRNQLGPVLDLGRNSLAGPGDSSLARKRHRTGARHGTQPGA